MLANQEFGNLLGMKSQVFRGTHLGRWMRVKGMESIMKGPRPPLIRKVVVHGHPSPSLDFVFLYQEPQQHEAFILGIGHPVQEAMDERDE